MPLIGEEFQITIKAKTITFNSQGQIGIGIPDLSSESAATLAWLVKQDPETNISVQMKLEV